MSSNCETSNSDEEEAKIKAIVFVIFCILLSVVLILSKWLHHRPKLNSYLSEPAMILIVGIIFSFLFSLGGGDENETYIDDDNDDDDYLKQYYAYDGDDAAMTDGDNNSYEIKGVANEMVSFSPHIFYMGLLPPILFYSGYELERELFMRHFKPIALFSLAGTTISAFGTGGLLYLFQSFGWFHNFAPTFLELLTFGSLIAATDTVSVLGVLKSKRVDPHLFSLVFGESALNDGVALVLFHTFADMLQKGKVSDDPWQSINDFLWAFATAAIGSPVMGILFSYLTALMFKYGDFRKEKVIELSLFVLLMYVPFILAELLHLSGIVGIFFTGIFARRYIEPNLSNETSEIAEEIFKLVAFLAETCIFLHVGLTIFGIQGLFRWDFILFALFAALIGRALSVYPISFIFNFSLTELVEDRLVEYQLEEEVTEDEDEDDDDDSSVGSLSTTSTASSRSGCKPWTKRRRTIPERRKDKKIPIQFMHILWFAGLRGAVAYACAVNFPDMNGNRDVFLSTTVIIVLFTVIIMGGAVETIIQYMGIRVNVDENEYMKEWRSRRKLKGCFHRLGT